MYSTSNNMLLTSIALSWMPLLRGERICQRSEVSFGMDWSKTFMESTHPKTNSKAIIALGRCKRLCWRNWKLSYDNMQSSSMVTKNAASESVQNVGCRWHTKAGLLVHYRHFENDSHCRYGSNSRPAIATHLCTRDRKV